MATSVLQGRKLYFVDIYFALLALNIHPPVTNVTSPPVEPLHCFQHVTGLLDPWQTTWIIRLIRYSDSTLLADHVDPRLACFNSLLRWCCIPESTLVRRVLADIALHPACRSLFGHLYPDQL